MSTTQQGVAAVPVQGAITATYDLSTTNNLAPKLGAVRYVENSSGQITKYRFVKNTSGSTIGANLAVVTTADATDVNFVSVSATSSLRQRYRGVTAAAIPAGYGGWVAYQGPATVTPDGTTAITKNHYLIPGAATGGAFESSSTAGNVAIGLAVGAANVTHPTPGTAWLTLPD